jgi:hypothetical protein
LAGPLTRQETTVRVDRFTGQRGRNPVGTPYPGTSVLADGSSHDSQFLARIRGSSKLTSEQIPAAALELNGLATGILEIPAVEGYEAAWNATFGGAQVGWGLAMALQPLRLGRFTDAASGDGQILLSTATQIGAHPAGGADINSIRASLVVSGSHLALRMRWGVSTWDSNLVDVSAHDFDPSVLTWFQFLAVAGSSDCTITVTASQVHPIYGFIAMAAVTHSEAKDWVVHQFWIGGTFSARQPLFGMVNPCPCVVAEVGLRACLTSTSSLPFGNNGSPWTRLAAPHPASVDLHDVWHLTDSTTEPVSIGGRKALLVGDSVRRDVGITTQQKASVRFDGTGMLVVRNAELFREAPKPAAAGGVEGHFLEHPASTFVLCIDPRRIPWRHPSVQRACFLCFSTPRAENLGVPTDPVGASGLRPGEHLRVEIEKVSTSYYLRAYFGELEPESLKHPTGTPGGNTTTAWPPGTSTAGEPPATWNKPMGDPTALYSAGNGKTAFQVLLGDEADVTHPMSYSWWVFLQRKFVAQGSGSNACAVFVRRVGTNGVLDTGFGEAKDSNADSAGERHPANQSCFSAAQLEGTDLNFDAGGYAFTLGGACGSQFGDEKLSYDTTTKLPCIYPVDGADVSFQFSDELEAFPFVGRVASIAFLKRYLLASDRLRIVTAGTVSTTLRLQYGDDMIFSVNAEEAVGNVLREARGADIAFADKVGVASILADPSTDVPLLVGCFPRPEAPWHNEVTVFPGEFSAVNGIVQRIDSGGREELYVVARPGLYQYDRDTHALTRITTLLGQGANGQASLVVDNNDVIHIAGGPGRPVIITREKVVAVSGLDAPFYSAPSSIITGPKTIAGGMTIAFQNKRNVNPLQLIGYEIDDGASVQFSIGFWSDVLKTRSAPGPVVTAQFVDPTAANPLETRKYRLLVSGLPPPRGPNANLITHWEVYRTDSNGRVKLLERRIPIGRSGPSTLVGDVATLGDPADYYRSVAPEGMRAIAVYGDRLVGIGIPEFPRQVAWTKRRDSMNWPALLYRANLAQTNSPAVGVVVRRDRAFPFSRDYLYQLLETGSDADPLAGIVQSLELTPLVPAGGLSHFAAADDHENGIYLPGNKTVFLTEGGTYNSMSLASDSAGNAGGQDFSWPDSWDLTEPDRFVSFHDERRRMVGICGPSKDDPNRIDAMCLYYEAASVSQDGMAMTSPVELSRLIGINMTCAASVLNPVDGSREVWFGSSLGHVLQMSPSLSLGVDYAWLDRVFPKLGIVMDAATSTTLRLDASYPGMPASDLFKGALLRIYRENVLVSTRRIDSVTVSASWVDVTLDGAHEAKVGDTWTAGAIPLLWISGKWDAGSLQQDKAVDRVDLTMAE